jgi:hypothetical protein
MMIWLMVILVPTALAIRPKPSENETPPSDLPPVGRSSERVINPLAAEVIASVLGEAHKVDSVTVESALGEMDRLVESEFNPTPLGVVADLADEMEDDAAEDETEEDVSEDETEEDVPVDETEDDDDDDVWNIESSEPEFILESPKEEAKLQLDQDDVDAIEHEVEQDFIPDAATLLGIESESEMESEPLDAPAEIESEAEEAVDESIDEDEIDSVEVEEDSELIPESIQSVSSPRSSTATISGEMFIRPTSLPATAELDPKTGRWMINGVPVGPKVTATGIDSESSSGRRIGGDDPLKESKKKAEEKSQPAERRGEKRCKN